MTPPNNVPSNGPSDAPSNAPNNSPSNPPSNTSANPTSDPSVKAPGAKTHRTKALKAPSSSQNRPFLRCQFLLHQPKFSSYSPSVGGDINPEQITPIYRTLFVTRQTFEQILDFGRFRYHLFLVYNKEYTYCAENVCLRALYDAMQAKDDPRQRLSANSCINLFMPIVRKDYAARMYMGPCTDEFDNPYTGERGPPIKLQVTTTPRQLGLEVTIHDSPRYFPVSVDCSIKNMHMNVLTFEREEVEIHKELERGLRMAVVAGRRCWIKTAYYYYNAAAFRREVDALVRSPRQHTIQQLVGFITVDGTGLKEEGEEMIDGIVLRARRGRVAQLSGVVSCTEEEGFRWKSQIGGAVELLHRAAVIWGRAVPENVMIDRDGNALIIDFSGGPSGDTREIDMRGLYQIFAFIDRITRGNDFENSNDTGGYESEDDNEDGDENESGHDNEGEDENKVQGQDDDFDEDYADINESYW